MIGSARRGMSSGGGRPRLRPHLGRLARATLYDPSGLLVSAEDVAGGSRIAISGGVGTATPELGVSWSEPLRDVAGRRIGAVGTTLGRPPIQGTFASRELAAWLAHATPTGNAYWVGVADGPLATAQHAVVYLCQNDAAGTQRIAALRKHSGSWEAINMAMAGDAGIKGAVGGFGTPLGTSDNFTYAAVAAYPYEGAPSSSTNYRTLSTAPLNLPSGTTPHLVWGCGGPTADVIEFAALAAAVSVQDLTTL